MKLEEIKELIGVMRKNKIKEISLEEKGVKVRIVAMSAGRAFPAESVTVQPAVSYAAPRPAELLVMPPAALPQPAAAEAAPAAPAKPAAAPEPEEGAVIKSPMVGTFYRAPAPDAPPYVDVGAVINPDSVLCIVEAMKLMNEIKAEIRGKILKVLVENGRPVEFNQPLFLVEAF
jgi:acetyl-CoA carboxylase biotin carboxyl carrier protein